MSLSPNYRLDESAHNPLWGVLLTFPLSYRKILPELYIILQGAHDPLPNLVLETYSPIDHR